jgi:acetyl-CoA carboxylase biotin carboxyl carrier protein
MRNDAERIAALAALMERHDLAEVKVKIGDQAVEIVRTPPAAAAPPAAGASDEGAPVATPSAPPPPQASALVKKVTAPLVGVFYRAPQPGAAPFVEIGDRVVVGQTLCIVEAMKLMNEITSDYAGVVTRVVAENSALVTLGEELFWIEP